MKLHFGSILVGTCIGVALVVLMSSLHTETLTSRLRKTSKGAHHFQQLVDEAHKLVEKKKRGAASEPTLAGAGAVKPYSQSSLKKDQQFVDPSEDLSHRPHPEHIEPLREGKFHAENKDKWEEQSYSKPYLDGQREVPCSNPKATEANKKAVEVIREIIDDEIKSGPSPDFGPAIKLFHDAVVADASCATPKFNLMIIELAQMCDFDKGPFLVEDGRLKRVEQELDTLLMSYGAVEKHDDLMLAKMHWYRGIIEELKTNSSHTASEYFHRAIALDSSLKTQHIHRTRRSYTLEFLRSVQRPVDYLYRKGLVQLLFYYEFAPRMGGFTRITYADTQRFLRDWHIKLDKALPPYVWSVVSRMYRLSFDNIAFPPIIGLYKGAASHESNGDAVNAWYNGHIEKLISRLAGVEVSPTYGYTAGYQEGDVLKPHTDRKACEFTMTTLIQAYPHVNYCPLYAQKTPWKIDRKWVGRYEDDTINYDDAVNIHPELNQWVIIRGRAVPHYRPPLAAGATCTTFLMHYVPKGEPEA